MVIKVEKLLMMEEFKDMDEEVLRSSLKAMESLVRSYTNNNFQNRNMRVEAAGTALISRLAIRSRYHNQK